METSTGVDKNKALYIPSNSTQKAIAAKWEQSKILIGTGEAGTGKTTGFFGQALMDLQHKRTKKLILARPLVEMDEETGFLPGDLNEKLKPWLMPFFDSFENLSFGKLELIENIEMVQIGKLKGRSFKNCTVLIDEAQNCTYKQLKCILTRTGTNCRVCLSGDFTQSDLNIAPNPLKVVCQKLIGIEYVNIFHFQKSDQLREPFLTSIINALD